MTQSKKTPCPECKAAGIKKLLKPSGFANHRRLVHGVVPRKFGKERNGVSTVSVIPKARLSAKERNSVELPKLPLEVLTDEDPTLGNVLKRITVTYNEREDQADRANYLKYLYEALEDIDDKMRDDEE
jgi:hypothetical protein